MNFQKRRKQFFLVSLVWGILLLILSLEPDRAVEVYLPNAFLRFGAHVFSYVILSFLLCLYFRFNRRFFGIRMTNAHVLLFSFLISLFWGGLTEFIQIFSYDRTPDWSDFFCDMAGALFGLMAFSLFKATDRG